MDTCVNKGSVYAKSTCLAALTNSPTKAPTPTSTYAPTKKADDAAASCFSADELIETEGGARVPISSIRVGDRVLASSRTGDFKYADVIAVPHGKNDIETSFVVVSTAATDLKLTPDHLILSGVCGSDLALKKAADVLVGSCLMTTTGQVNVSGISVARGKGVYTIVTTEELVVVNGIVASPFALNHFAADSFYNVVRLLHRSSPAMLKSSFVGGLLFERFASIFGMST
jgi:hypothetical protein